MRINGIEVRGECGYDQIEPGRYFLIRVSDTNHGEWYELIVTPCRTNRSLEQRLEGWLGSTNNIDMHACGAVEIYKDARGRLAARKIDAWALLDEVSPDVEL